jgi:DNA-3-methyladenine glycosylase
MNLDKLPAAFFRKPAVDLARGLLGTILIRRHRGRVFRARVVEAEAYVGAHDLACHAAKGRTARTEVMFGPAGRAYVYLVYGMHHLFNIVAGEEGDPQAVLLRGAVPLDGWEADLSGPGKLARQFHITREHYGLEVTGDELYFAADPGYRPDIRSSPRIGVEYSGAWQHELLRFFDANYTDEKGRVRKADRKAKGGTRAGG